MQARSNKVRWRLDKHFTFENNFELKKFLSVLGNFNFSIHWQYIMLQTETSSVSIPKVFNCYLKYFNT